ncbi:hypothetical protein [Sulfurimonas sp.]
MSEPTLESIGDYNTLKGEKKRIVWAVIIAGIIIGVIYSISYKVFDDSEESIKTQDEIIVVPMSQSIPVR